MSSHKNNYCGIGVMTGTSLDGVDLVCATFSDATPSAGHGSESSPSWSYEMHQAESLPLPDAWRERLRALPSQSASVLAQTHVDWGHFLGKIVADWIEKHTLEPDFVACHGQTIFHQPEHGFTAQIGDGETMVSHLKVPLVTQFRNKDLALGGQGAPLVPFGERWLLHGHAAFLNLGGMANLTVGKRAMDVCVCNMALNRLMQSHDPSCHYDESGSLAASGSVDRTLLEALESIAWYRTPPPRSLGEEWYQRELEPLLLSHAIPVENRLATYCEHVAMRVVASLKSLLETADSAQSEPTLLVSGGGAHHHYLVTRLEHHLALQSLPLKLVVEPALTDFKEALLFAFLGLQVLLGRPNVWCSVTGSSMDHLGGSLHLPPEGGWRLERCAHGGHA